MAPKSAFWFGLVHTGSIGTGAVLVPGFGTQPYRRGTLMLLAYSISAQITLMPEIHCNNYSDKVIFIMGQHIDACIVYQIFIFKIYIVIYYNILLKYTDNTGSR